MCYLFVLINFPVSGVFRKGTGVLRVLNPPSTLCSDPYSSTEKILKYFFLYIDLLYYVLPLFI